MGYAAQAGMGYNLFGIEVHSPDFNPIHWYQAVKNLVTPGPANVLTDKLSYEQKAEIVQQETKDLIRAGMDAEKARTQAESDVTAVLISNNADPSQAEMPLWQWIALGGAGLALLIVIIKD